MKCKLTLFFVFYIVVFSASSQKRKDSLYANWKNLKLSDSTRANSFHNYISNYYLNRHTDSSYIFTKELIDFTKTKNLKLEQANALLILGDIEGIYGNYNSAIKHYNTSLNLFKESDSKSGEAKSLLLLGDMYQKNWKFDEANTYFEESLKISESLKDTLGITRSILEIGTIYQMRYKADQAIEIFNNCLKLLKNKNNPNLIASIYGNIGDCYLIKKEYQKSIDYLNKAIKIGETIDNSNILTDAYTLLSRNYFKQKKYDKLLETSRTSLEYAEKISKKSKIEGAYYFMFEAYRGKKDFDSTFYYYDKGKVFRTEAADLAAERTLQKLEIDNARTKDSLMSVAKELKTKIAYQSEKTKLTLAWGGSLSAISIFAFVVYRNTKRKQLKSERERQKQIKEKAKILKDLELSIIDAMIEGQEKERERLASDLHDNVGATIAAAKIQFQYLIKHQDDVEASKELIKKTSSLLEDAYLEIRSMAHLKNSGVMAKNGLLPAVEKLSKSASGINGLEFEIKSFGLENRLDNTLEISVFRIIQELVTNIIKHANATKSTVHLTNHDNSLNIMIEDNGVGFNPDLINTSSSGMGISSIDKRVEHLNGTLNIESEKNKGTNIIIDIPI